MTHPEQWKYEAAYEIENYRMGNRRKAVAYEWIGTLAALKYLDVGCGRGETLDWARRRGLVAYGTELVPQLCNDFVIHAELEDLPFADHEFDYVSCYDVLEHLIPGHEQTALDELFRVCRKEMHLSTNDRPSTLPDGTDLHINKRPREAWQDDIVARAEKRNGQVFFSTFGVLDHDWLWRIVFP